MCFGRSKEPSHRDGSFEYPKYMLWPRNEKMRENLSSKFPKRVSSATVTSENLNIFKTSPFLELCAKSLYPYNCASALAHLSLICSDSFTILGLLVLGLAVSNINESQLQTYGSKTLFLMTSLQYYCITGLPGTRWNKNLCAKDAGCAGNKITVSVAIVLYYALSDVGRG